MTLWKLYSTGIHASVIVMVAFLIMAVAAMIPVSAIKAVASESCFASPPPSLLGARLPLPRNYNAQLGSKVDDGNGDDGDDDTGLTFQPQLTTAESRRAFLLQQVLTASLLTSSAASADDSTTTTTTAKSNYFSLREKLKSDTSAATASAKKVNNWIMNPFRRWDSVETCLLELLPVRNGVFRKLQESLEVLEVKQEFDLDNWESNHAAALATLNLLDSRRSILEPVFNQEDPTALFIAKNTIGEQKIEALRSNIVRLAFAAENRNATCFYSERRSALLALGEVGELLVPSFPYRVPVTGKYSYLPRLLGRCRVTLAIERNRRPLGNVTVVADGFLAPVTAGNFVDLCLRNFYVGLSVRAMRKRLGVAPSRSDNVIVNDLAAVRDNLADFGSSFSGLEGDGDVEVVGSDADVEVIGEGGGGFFSFLRPKEPSLDDNYNRNRRSDKEDEFEYEYGEGRVTMDVTLPILGSYQEGFYDPLTAKPRRLPLEIVAMDGNKAKLTYSSRFSPLEGSVVSDDKKKNPSSSTIATSSPGSLKPVLSFDVPGLVAMNHPDRVSNGASSEFFSIPKRDISKKRTRLLDGQFAPFGYITDGLELYQSLRPGDVIGATYVSEWGALNLVKIRKNAFDNKEDAGTVSG